MEAFIKVYIKSEDDLPKYGEGELLCQLKSGKIGYYPIGTIRCDYERVDWYLKPVEIPEISDTEINNVAANEIDPGIIDEFQTGKSFTAIKRRIWSYGAKWYREELKKRMNHA